jgi:ribokinase
LVPAGTNLCVSMNAPLEARPLLVVGSVNADVVIKVPRLPKAGETLKAGGGDVNPGGKGANQAVAAAKMGARVRFAGVFGSDSHGKMLRETMQQAGVCTELSTTSAGPSGQAIILLEPSGANTIMLVPGANADWSVELPSGLLDAIAASVEVLKSSLFSDSL